MEQRKGDPNLDHLNLNENQIAEKDDFKVKRDEDGEVLPTETPVPGWNKYIVHFPAERGKANKYLPRDYNLARMQPNQIAGFLSTFLIRPDPFEFSDKDRGDYTAEEIEELREEGEILTGDDVDDGDWYAFADPETLVQIILDESGYDIMKAQMAETLGGNSQMTDEVLKKAEEMLDGSTDN